MNLVDLEAFERRPVDLRPRPPGGPPTMTSPDRPDSPRKPRRRPEDAGAAALDASTPAAEGAEAPEPPPAPEPMTPEKVAAWNRYLDRYVAGGVLLLVLLAAIRPISGNSSLFTLLRAGELISRQGPVTTDPFSYTQAGQPWVNVPWLYEVLSWQAFEAGRSAVSNDPARALQVGGSVLVAINAVLMTLAALVLLGVRRRGPGLWWAACCVMIALGGFVFPGGPYGLAPAVGGLAGREAQVSPQTCGVLLLCVELLILHRAINQGRRGWLYALPLVFLLWANLDASFLFGLAILAVTMLGSLIKPLLRPKGEEVRPPGWGLGLGIVAASAAVCLVNPSTYHVFLVAFDPYRDMFNNLTGKRGEVPLTYDLLSFFDPESRQYFDRSGGMGSSRLYMAFYLVVVWAGLLSFAVNWRGFALGRFLAYVVAALAWAGMIRLAPFFAPVLAAALILNGQEWYQSQFGAEGRLGTGWKLWSDGGRALTILGIFAFLTIAITGYTSLPGESPLGFGVRTGTYAFETAEYLRDSGTEGRVLNLTLAHGDALVWSDPIHKPFIDSRAGVFPDSQRIELKNLRNALRDDDRAAWQPVLDREGITVVMISPGSDPQVFEGLRRSPDWVALHDGGNAVLFGRVDQPGADRDRFLESRLDADSLVYKHQATVPMPERPPAPIGWIDRVVRSRALTSAGPQVASADRWLTGVWSPGASGEAPDPARCIMAIREARAALAANPDDPSAFLVLHRAYSLLTEAEQAILAAGSSAEGQEEAAEPKPTIGFRSASGQARLSFSRAPLTPPADVVDAFRVIQERFIGELAAMNQTDESEAREPSASWSSYRYRERIATLNYAIQTTPEPQSPEDREQLANLNLALADQYLSNQVLDLAVDRLKAARELLPPREMPEPRQRQLDQLDEQVETIRAQLDDLAVQNPQLNSPIPMATQAVQAGLLGMAIEQLKSAEGYGISEVQVRPLLVDLYCRVGRPDEAFNLLEEVPPADPSLSTSPGSAPYRQGLVHLLLGYYRMTEEYWQRYAIPMIRQATAGEALAGGRSLLIGDPISAVRMMLDITGTPAADGLVETQASWEAELGLALLEGGLPQDLKNERGEVVQPGAISHFINALKLDPDVPSRPLLVYYIEKLGGQVPPRPEPAAEPEPAANPEPAGAADVPPAEPDAAAEPAAEPEPAAEKSDEPEAPSEGEAEERPKR